MATALLFLLHGLIHLLGFLKPWKLADVPQLSGHAIVPLSEGAFRAVGILWLMTAVALVTAALLRLMENGSWWMVAAGPRAVAGPHRAAMGRRVGGTVANVLLALAVAVGAGTHSFHEANLTHARALFARAPAGNPPILRADDTATLPPPVRRWLETSGAVGRPRARTVRLLQRGRMRTGPDQPYMPAEARQYFIVDEPG